MRLSATMKKHGKMKPAPGIAVDILLGEAQKIETDEPGPRLAEEAPQCCCFST